MLESGWVLLLLVLMSFALVADGGRVINDSSCLFLIDVCGGLLTRELNFPLLVFLPFVADFWFCQSFSGNAWGFGFVKTLESCVSMLTTGGGDGGFSIECGFWFFEVVGDGGFSIECVFWFFGVVGDGGVVLGLCLVSMNLLSLGE